MDRHNIDSLIAKHLAGETTKQENAYLNQWLNSSVENQDEFNKIAIAFQLTAVEQNPIQKQSILAEINSKIEKKRISQAHKLNTEGKVKYWWMAAATFIIFISLSLLFDSENADNSASVLQEQMVTKMNPAGQKSKIYLPDGSVVWLNSDSYLKYESNFNDSIRFINMEGEAYFEVKRDVKRPFVVQSKSLTTTALGTAFNINTFHGEDEIHVGLTEGVVSIEKNGVGIELSKIIINPGEGVVYNPSINFDLAKVQIDIEGIKRWKDGILQLHGNSFNETIQILSRWYGVEFYVENSPKRTWQAEGLFDNESLENVLRNLGFSQGFEFAIDGKEIYITFI